MNTTNIALAITTPDDFATYPEQVQNELFARISYACNPGLLHDELTPTKIQVTVEFTSQRLAMCADEEWQNNGWILFPEDQFGCYAYDANYNSHVRTTPQRFVRVDCRWDDESTSNIRRDQFGELFHWI